MSKFARHEDRVAKTYKSTRLAFVEYFGTATFTTNDSSAVKGLYR